MEALWYATGSLPRVQNRMEWGGKAMTKIGSQKESKFKLFGILFSKQKGNIYLKFAKPIILGGAWYYDSSKYYSNYKGNDKSIWFGDNRDEKWIREVQ